MSPHGMPIEGSHGLFADELFTKYLCNFGRGVVPEDTEDILKKNSTPYPKSQTPNNLTS